ncbi:MAG: PH domain-containing protein [Geodermatophilaceae bacterium]|nr:PH domain-containing protein [Geodermatophilaceae bacterium]
MTGKKIEYHSVPYKSITHFAVETAGNFDLDAELKIWLSGSSGPIQKQFSKGVDIYEVQALMTHFITG